MFNSEADFGLCCGYRCVGAGVGALATVLVDDYDVQYLYKVVGIVLDSIDVY